MRTLLALIVGWSSMAGAVGCSGGSAQLPGAHDGGVSDAGEPPPILASSYANDCVSDQDCVTVPATTEDLCGCGSYCSNAAISKSVHSKYSADVSAQRALCPPRGAQQCPLIANCPSKALCNGGKCAACIEDGNGGYGLPRCPLRDAGPG